MYRLVEMTRVFVSEQGKIQDFPRNASCNCNSLDSIAVFGSYRRERFHQPGISRAPPGILIFHALCSQRNRIATSLIMMIFNK